jgi:hypothetical protein
MRRSSAILRIHRSDLTDIAYRRHLLGRRALAAGDDRARVAHAAARRARLAGDEADDRLASNDRLDERGRLLLALPPISPIMTTPRSRVLVEQAQRVDERSCR